MRCLAIFAVLLLSLVDARVKFLYSEILQAPDIAGTNKTNFKCAHQCMVYVDRKSDKLMITQDDRVIACFSTIVSGNAVAPTGVVLPPGDNYYLENKGDPNPEFVMYIVDRKADNNGASVYAPQETQGVAVKDNARYVTVLSSYEAVWFSSFAGAFPVGWPRIYATPYDAVGGTCRQVYQAFSPSHAEKSWPTIATAVLTIDFGFVGAHNVSVNTGNLKDMKHSSDSSIVYTSPGYIGCQDMPGQNYYSKLSQVQDTFSLTADGLHVVANYDSVTDAEPVQLTVGDEKVNLVGTDIYGGFLEKGTYDVTVSWQRKTAGSSFAMQLDFGIPDPPQLQSTTARPQSTTSIGRSLSVLCALALVIAACLW